MNRRSVRCRWPKWAVSLAKLLYTPMLTSVLARARFPRQRQDLGKRRHSTPRARRILDEFELPESCHLGRDRPASDGLVQPVPEPWPEPAWQRDQLFGIPGGR